MFRNRIDAAQELAKALEQYRGRDPLVLGIPRGAVPIAKVVAEELNGDFDVVLARKLRAPGSPELAVGAVDETGWLYVAPYAMSVGANESYLEMEKSAQMETIRRRRAQYASVRSPRERAGRVLIVVDDGLATGATMIAALHGLRHLKPEKLVCAVPVASRESLAQVREIADDVICLDAPLSFRAVSQVYEHFEQVDDNEVLELLKDKP